jgi:hypothetical protein
MMSFFDKLKNKCEENLTDTYGFEAAFDELVTIRRGLQRVFDESGECLSFVLRPGGISRHILEYSIDMRYGDGDDVRTILTAWIPKAGTGATIKLEMLGETSEFEKLYELEDKVASVFGNAYVFRIISDMRNL